MSIYKYYLSFLTTFLFFIGLSEFNLSAQTSLDDEVVLDITTGSAKRILNNIEENNNVIFSYSSRICTPSRVVLESSQSTLKQILDQIFVSCYVEYKQVGNKIFILPVSLDDLRFRVKGIVRDSLSGEVLIAANVFDLYGSQGAVSNDYGFYSISLPGGNVLLGCSYVGYKSKRLVINLSQDTLINIYLPPQSILNEVPVLGRISSNGVKSSQTSIIDLPVNKLQNVPSFFGEVDLVKMIQMFPGIQSGSEGFSGLYVRGGGHDENLILLDEVPIYNIEHLLGFFSVFNADAINNVKLIKGGFPAQYGGRLSSVLDIKTYEGNKERMKGAVSIGLLSSRLSLDGPFKNNKTTYSLSFRRTYYDLIASPLQSSGSDNSKYYFFDLNAKINHQFSDRSRLFLSSYWGYDELKSNYNFKEITRSLVDNDIDDDDLFLNDEINTGWGNVITALRWNYIYNDHVFSNLTCSYSNYTFHTLQEQDFIVDDNWSSIQRKYSSGIRDIMLKADFDYFPKINHHIKFGGNYTYHRFYPGIDVLQTSITSAEVQDTTIGGKALFGSEFHLYIQDDFSLASYLKINAGLHTSMYHTGKKKYYSLEPRLSARFLVNSRFAFKAAYSSMTQYVHLLSTANVSLPTDLWLPVTSTIEPMRAWQTALEGVYEVKKGFTFSTEFYYKRNFNLIDYKESQSFFDFSTNWTDKLTTGSSNAYGVELLLQRAVGRWSGWFGYTLSKSQSTFPDLNNGNPFRSNNDRRHDVSLFYSYAFNKRVDANFTWVFSSGKPVTLPNEKYYSPDLPTVNSLGSSYSENYTLKNGYRMPNYHRLDIGFNFYKDKKWGKRIWSMGVMNAYGRQNPFFLYFSDNTGKSSGEIDRSLKQFSIFPFPFPYVRYTIQF